MKYPKRQFLRDNTKIFLLPDLLLQCKKAIKARVTTLVTNNHKEDNMTKPFNTSPGRKTIIKSAAYLSMTALAVFFMPVNQAQARDQIHIVGSSTVYPFAT